MVEGGVDMNELSEPDLDDLLDRHHHNDMDEEDDVYDPSIHQYDRWPNPVYPSTHQAARDDEIINGLESSASVVVRENVVYNENVSPQHDDGSMSVADNDGRHRVDVEHSRDNSDAIYSGFFNRYVIDLDSELPSTCVLHELWTDDHPLTWRVWLQYLQETVLFPGSSPHTVVRYIRSLQYLMQECNQIGFLFQYVCADLERFTEQTQMNLAYFDMQIPEFFIGTTLAGISALQIVQFTEMLLLNLSQVYNIHNCVRAFRTSMLPILHRPPDSVELENVVVVGGEDDKRSDAQILLEFLIQRAQQQQLRRLGTAMYKPRREPGGQHTLFFEYDCEISEFIYRSVAPSRVYPLQYKALTAKPSTPSQTINLLTHVQDVRCPMLKKSRYLFSFRNGVFDIRTARFSTYSTMMSLANSTANYFDFVVNYDEHIGGDVCNLQTPIFDKILVDQHMNDSDRYWFFVMCGRLLFNVGDLDDWQVCLYIHGVAGSGKSTILRLLALFYEPSDVGYLMSDGQATFSDEHLYDKFMTLAFDVDKRTQFSVTRLNSIVSGEPLSINRKHKTALNAAWKGSLAMGSNNPPPWPDTAGNLIRRFVIFPFEYPIRESDTRMFDRLKTELPLLLIKMVRLYLSAVHRYGHTSLWGEGILPKMCHRARKQYLVASNPLSAFLESDHVRFAAGTSVPATDFRKRLADFIRENGDRKASTTVISKLDHAHLFAMYGCTLDEITNEHGVRRVIIHGLTLVDGVDGVISL